MIDRVV